MKIYGKVSGNRLSVLPPELGALDLIGNKQVFRLEYNPWVANIQEQFDARGAQGVMDFIRSDQYKYFYGRQTSVLIVDSIATVFRGYLGKGDFQRWDRVLTILTNIAVHHNVAVSRLMTGIVLLKLLEFLTYYEA
uniref:ATPase domain-containing protein n=1 Tax=Angiostrongylus cantonensis TaxID=6313 RepID=A0A0K0DF38_ANGCA